MDEALNARLVPVPPTHTLCLFFSHFFSAQSSAICLKISAEDGSFDFNGWSGLGRAGGLREGRAGQEGTQRGRGRDRATTDTDEQRDRDGKDRNPRGKNGKGRRMRMGKRGWESGKQEQGGAGRSSQWWMLARPH